MFAKGTKRWGDEAVESVAVLLINGLSLVGLERSQDSLDEEVEIGLGGAEQVSTSI